MEVQDILEQVKTGDMSVEETAQYLRRAPLKKWICKVGCTQKLRSGFMEVIFCSGKADEHLLHIYKKLYEEDGEVFGTRASKEQYQLVKTILPDIEYDEISHMLEVEKKEKAYREDRCLYGRNGRYSGGGRSGADGGYFGSHVERIYDVGVQWDPSSDVQTGCDTERE